MRTLEKGAGRLNLINEQEEEKRKMRREQGKKLKRSRETGKNKKGAGSQDPPPGEPHK